MAVTAESIAKQEKLNIKKTILMGFGFLSTSVAWGIYDPYVTRILRDMLGASGTVAQWSAKLANVGWISQFMATQGESTTDAAGAFTIVPLLIGIIMTFDNIFGVIFQPTFGKLSDRCRSKYGKRRPFIFFGAPISAFLFVLIPFMPNIPSLMTVVILFVFVMSLWRAPVVALMPDLTAPHLRSEGNAIINLCGGAGGLIGMMAGTIVVGISGLFGNKLEGVATYPWVFGLAALIMIISTIVLRFQVEEPDSRVIAAAEQNKAADEKAAKKAEKEQRKAMKLSGGERKSLVFMLLCLFFLFCATNAIQTFFGLFALEVLDKETNESTMMMAVFAVFSMIGAIPAGKLGKKIGRKKTIMLGLGLFMAMLFAVLLFDPKTNLSALTIMVWIALVVGGFANMLITVNTLPLVLEIGGVERVGTYTGYYYTATFSAQIATPIIYGFIRMMTGTYLSLFYYCPILFVLAFLCLTVVKHGEAKIDPNQLDKIVEQVELENAD